MTTNFTRTLAGVPALSRVTRRRYDLEWSIDQAAMPTKVGRVRTRDFAGPKVHRSVLMTSPYKTADNCKRNPEP
jgi:hypothetical protein